MKKWLLITLLVLLLPLLSHAQLVLSLERAREILVEKSLDLKQRELEERIAMMNVDLAKDAAIPSIYFNANNQHTLGLAFDQVTGQLITGNQWSNYANANIAANVILFQGFQKVNTIKAEELNLELAKLDVEKLKRELELQLLSLFFQTLINHDLYEASLVQLKLSEQQLAQEEIQIEVGKRTIIDLSQAKSKVANDKLNIVTAKNGYNLGLLKLKQLLEMAESDELELVPPTASGLPLAPPEEYLINDPYLKAIERRIDLAHVNIKIAKSAYYPTISLNGGYGTNYSSQRYNMFNSMVMPLWEQFNQNRSLYGNISISMPIYDGFKARANTKKARLGQENLLFEKGKVIKQRKEAFSQSELEYQASIEELKALEAAFEANKVNYEAMNERYKIGKSSSMDLYKALTDYNVSEFRLINARYSMLYKGEILKTLTK